MIYALWENLRIALSSLRANKMRSLLTTLGIVIGIATVIAIISVIEGLNLAFAAELSSIGSNSVYVQKFRWMSHDWNITKKWPDIGEQELAGIRTGMTQSDLATPMLHTIKTVKYKGRKIEDTMVSGVGDNYQELRQIYSAVGRFLGTQDIAHNRNVAVVGWEVAEKLFGREYPVGKKVFVGGIPLTVIGVLQKRGDFFDMNLDRTVILPIGAFRHNFGTRRSMTILVRPVDPNSPDRAIDELRTILRRVRGLAFDEDDNFAINKVDALRELYDKLTGGLYAAMFGVAAISLLVGGVGIMNIMLVSVIERTKEIGIRKALGARRAYILLQFLIEAVVLSIAGGILGVAAGFGVAMLVDAVSPVPATVRPWSVWVGLGFSAAVGIVFGIWPARRAALKDPIDALRFE